MSSALPSNLKQIAEADLDQLKEWVKAIGSQNLSDMCNDVAWVPKSGLAPPTLRLKDNYQVTFQHPTRANDFKRFGCHPGDEFYLGDVRMTKHNLIFIFASCENVKRNMARHAVGPGLTKLYETAEFTLKNIKDDRMTGRGFLRDVVLAYRDWDKATRSTDDLYKHAAAGSW